MQLYCFSLMALEVAHAQSRALSLQSSVELVEICCALAEVEAEGLALVWSDCGLVCP